MKATQVFTLVSADFSTTLGRILVLPTRSLVLSEPGFGGLEPASASAINACVSLSFGKGFHCCLGYARARAKID